MHKNVVVVMVGVFALFLGATSAKAGFILNSLSFSSPDSPDGLIGLAFNTDEEGNAEVFFGEVFQEDQRVFTLNVSGETDDDPVMTVTKVIENTTGFDWIGYNIDLDVAGSATFSGTPVSNRFTFDAGASTDTSLVFVPPTGVADGQSVTFVFDILVPDAGPFGFTITQTPIPIPEPSTLLMGLLMACGASAIVLRKRWG